MQLQRYACTDTLDDDAVESEHVAPFAHGLLAHSITSTSQLPPVATAHCAVYCEMKSYPHTPLAKPATHAQLYACTGRLETVVESEHVAPFAHGLLAHSITSTSQIPSSATVH
jgi:2-phosphoglycerate kinase